MEYDWDKSKVIVNLSKHSASFEEAKNFFDDPLYAGFYDPDHLIGGVGLNSNYDFLR